MPLKSQEILCLMSNFRESKLFLQYLSPYSILSTVHFKNIKPVMKDQKRRRIISYGNSAGRNKKVAARTNKVWYGKMAMGRGKTISITCGPVEDPAKEIPSIPFNMTQSCAQLNFEYARKICYLSFEKLKFSLLSVHPLTHVPLCHGNLCPTGRHKSHKVWSCQDASSLLSHQSPLEAPEHGINVISMQSKQTVILLHPATSSLCRAGGSWQS